MNCPAMHVTDTVPEHQTVQRETHVLVGDGMVNLLTVVRQKKGLKKNLKNVELALRIKHVSEDRCEIVHHMLVSNCVSNKWRFHTSLASQSGSHQKGLLSRC